MSIVRSSALKPLYCSDSSKVEKPSQTLLEQGFEGLEILMGEV